MIQIQNISHSFGKNRVFDTFSATIENGSKIVINASSGSGKSTLLKMILGFIQPDSGSIEVDRVLLNENSVGSIRSKISYISQQIPFPDIPVEEFFKQVFEYAVNSDVVYSEEEALLYFERFNLEESILKSIASELSGGEKQRVALIIALILKREILLLDEVTSGLDTELKKIVVETISNFEMTVIVVSHDKEWFFNDKYSILSLGSKEVENG